MKHIKAYENTNKWSISVDELLAFGKAQKIVSRYNEDILGNAYDYIEFWKDKINPNIDDFKVDVDIDATRKIIRIVVEDLDISSLFDTLTTTLDDFADFCNNQEVYKASKKYNL